MIQTLVEVTTVLQIASRTASVLDARAAMSDAAGIMPAISETEQDGGAVDAPSETPSNGAPVISAQLPPVPPGSAGRPTSGAGDNISMTAAPSTASVSAPESASSLPGKTAGTSDEPPEKAPWAESSSPSMQVGSMGCNFHATVHNYPHHIMSTRALQFSLASVTCSVSHDQCKSPV